jgi:hypothetical protein
MSIESLLRKKAEQQKAESEKPKLEVVSVEHNQPNIGHQPNQHNLANLTNPTNFKSVSPIKDFAKVPNSITRFAVPERYFKGMSKNTYDALYLKTRGAINPIRKIRATKSDLIRWTGVSDVTIDKHIKHLKSVGLLKVEFIIGSHDGNWYEVFIPEEIETPDQPNIPNQPNQPNMPKEVGGKVPNLVGEVGEVQLLEKKEFTEKLNTSLNTNTKNDDEPFGAMIEVLSKTGKGKREDWRKLAELLIMEFEVAAARTKEVTNVPAFLTEHLRRRLMPVKREAPKLRPNKSAQIGSQQSSQPVEEYQAEALTKEGRESTLKTFAGYIEKGQKKFLMGLEDTYTKEDWKWLMKELKIA